MDASSPQFAQLKSALKSTWMAGDFGEIAKYAAREGENFVSRLQLSPGQRVLDVACGTGNTAIPAARTGVEVIGVDIAPNLLEQARQRAAAENLSVKFEEGDAEELPFKAREFDVVVSMFGAMFAPRPELVVKELLRVCKPGGLIAMANWTPEGFIGKTFRATAQLAPPPPGVPPPVLWGDEQVVKQRFSSGIAELKTEKHTVSFKYPFPPEKVVALFRQYFGPTMMTYSRLDAAGQSQLTTVLESLWREHNLASDGNTSVEGEYLEVRVVPA
jgi:ubiquinone/menaquinone biosynthesis C-methylase UbiE